ncbi:MAG TPA: metalloregulator ArsR/SmtB family transcription factor [bacterium]|nr:metalloregulator ArsR/SmtB family transcription factor [bacterium]
MKKALSNDKPIAPVDRVFSALGDPVRLEIIRILMEKKEAPCGDCGLPVGKSTLSHHYKVLREIGFIKTRGEGTRQINCLQIEEINRRFPGLLEWIGRPQGP